MDFLVENIDSITIVIYCFVIGIVLAFTVALITKGIYGKFVDALVRENADCEVNAKTLDELGIKKNFILLACLSHRTVLSSLISCDSEEKKPHDRHYYILPEHQIKAQGLFGTEKLSPLTFAAAVLLLIVILLICQFVLPEILK